MTLTDQFKDLIEKATISPDMKEYLDREEVGDAELFNFMFAGKAVFDHTEKRWFLWDGNLWLPDMTHMVYMLIENNLAAEYLGAAETERRNGNTELSNQFVKRAKQLLNLNRIRNVLKLASCLTGLALEGKEWDTPPMLLPVINGIVNLEDGTFRKAIPSDYIRSYVPTEWHGLNYPAPQWEQALSTIFDGDHETMAYIQRLFGYSITGDTREQVLPILWGDGANGKSTLMDIISAILGNEFCFTTQADSLMNLREGDGNAPCPFIHALRNKRLVWASEIKEGRRLNAGLIKQLTGDRYFTARPLYGGPVTFKQTYKIFLITNNCPRLPDGDDPAISRRIIRVSFGNHFVDDPKLPLEHKRDKELFSKLRKEGPGILAWLVSGCLAWQKEGLNPPFSVMDSTERYREDEDLIGHFIEDSISIGEGLEVSASFVYKDYVRWCEESGYLPMSLRSLGQIMTRRFGQLRRSGLVKKPKGYILVSACQTDSNSLHITELTVNSEIYPKN